ncbi:MAG: DUF11 domain-containing protein, partial [Caldilineaceae bacterium]|nr:DUF11 domain-containing protein [Caldilineaceae bacterium]
TVLIDGYIYSVGGWDGTKPQQGIYAAAVTTTGISSWQQVGILPSALYRHAVTGTKGYLYVTGGFDAAGTAQATVLATKVNGIGAIGSWQTPPSLPMNTYYHNLVIHDGRLMALGGRNDSTFFDTVYSAPIGTDGLPGTWRAERALPIPLHRFGAVVVARHGSEYLFLTAGLRGENSYQNTVYHSNIPLPPTPTATATATPTPTPTPTPTAAVSAVLSNAPNSWIAPGQAITYTIRYRNGSVQAVNNVEISNPIPGGVELVADRIHNDVGTYTVVGTQNGAIINWQIGTLAAKGEGNVSYTVQRPLSPTPVIPLALDITIDAPETAARGEAISYHFTVTNRAPIPLTDLVITNALPAGARYLSGGDGEPVNGIVRWSIAQLAAESVAELSYQVRAQSSLVNYDFQVTSKEGAGTRGRTVAVTIIDGQQPRVGDGFIVVNKGATILWDVVGQGLTSNATYNPSFELYLPAVQNGE